MQTTPLTRAQRSRQVIIWTGLTLLGAHLILIAALHGKSRILDTPRLRQGVAYIKAARADTPSRPSVVYVGSSRGQDGFNPAEFMTWSRQQYGRPTEAYNLSFVGGGPLRNWLVVHRLIERRAVPDVVFIEVAPMLAMGGGDKHGLNEHLDRTWLYPRECEQMERRGWLEPRSESTFANLINTPWHEQRSSLLQHVAPNWLDTLSDGVTGPDDRGWFPFASKNYPSPEWDRTMEHLRKKYQATLQEFRPNEAATAALRETVVDATRRGAKVVIVLAPEGPRFRSFYSPQAAADFVAFYRNLAAELHTPFLNARELIDDESLFMDSHHMQADGATVYSHYLANEVDHLLRPEKFSTQ